MKDISKLEINSILSDGDNNIRPVNILTIQWLIFNNVKYVIE